MAESKKAKAAKPRPKKTKAAAAKTPSKRAPSKPVKKAAPAKAKRAAPKQKAAPRRPASKSATINIFDLIDHPLVADLLSVGAMAAVAAIADHNVKTRTGEAESGSSKAVKAAGKAAATAMGKRLLTEVDAIKKASKPQPAKRGSK